MRPDPGAAADVLREFFLAFVRRGRASSCAPLRPGAAMIAEMQAERDACRREEGGGGMCHLVTEFAEARWGWPRVAVAYLDPAGDVICGAHYVNILPDAAILDPTADQFGDGGDVRIVAHDDPGYLRYRPEWSPDYNPGTDAWCARIEAALGVRYIGGEDEDAAVANRSARGEGWWVSDRTALIGYWQQAAWYADQAGDELYLRLASDRLKALGEVGGAASPQPGPGEAPPPVPKA